jgi:hypothetical protein
MFDLRLEGGNEECKCGGGSERRREEIFHDRML